MFVIAHDSLKRAATFLFATAAVVYVLNLVTNTAGSSAIYWANQQMGSARPLAVVVTFLVSQVMALTDAPIAVLCVIGGVVLRILARSDAESQSGSSEEHTHNEKAGGN